VAVRRFPTAAVNAASHDLVLGIRAGGDEHRFIALWPVVVEGRVFVRSWSRKPGGWHDRLLREPFGVVQLGEVEYRFRAVHTRSERLKSLVDEAYLVKYHTPSSMMFTTDLIAQPSRETTTELVPDDRPA